MRVRRGPTQVQCLEDLAQKQGRGLPRTRHSQVKIRSAHLLRQHDDLARMLLHVSNDLVDRLQHRDILSPLGSRPLGQPLGRKCFDDSASLLDGLGQEFDQLRDGRFTLRAELFSRTRTSEAPPTPCMIHCRMLPLR